MRHLDLFSGIGGFALATEMVWDNVEHSFCDIDPFCQAVLKKHWPHAPIHDDIKTYRGGSGTVDLLTGGFPCQPFSNAGKRKGTADDRHLWPEMLRVIREAAPRWIIGENVGGLLTWDDGLVLEQVLTDLEGSGYEAWPFVIPAAAVDAPHRRDRVWIVAHRYEFGRVYRQFKKLAAKAGEQALGKPFAGGSDVADTNSVDVQRSNAQTEKIGTEQGERPSRLRGCRAHVPDPARKRCAGRAGGLKHRKGQASVEKRHFALDGVGGYLWQWPAEPDVGRVAHGVPARVDRIKSLGNAIVPQVAAEIMRAIKAIDL